MSTATAAARILLVERDAGLSALVTTAFEAEGFDVVTARDGDIALDLAAEYPPDLVILDATIAARSGIDGCRRFRASRTTTHLPIIVVAPRDIEARHEALFDGTADDYVSKPFLPRDLVARSLTILRRVRPEIGGALLTAGDLVMDTTRFRAWRCGRGLRLGPTEYRLLRHFLEHPQRIFSREQLLDAIWGRDGGIELRTVDVHVRRLRKAINAGGSLDMIRTVRATGYGLDPFPDVPLPMTVGDTVRIPDLRAQLC